MKVHPFADKFPLITREEYETFKAGIKATGGIDTHPILYRVLKGGQPELLDGRNRKRACQELRIKPKMKKVVVSDAEAIDFIKACNINRRHMTAIQRQEMVVALRQEGESVRSIAEVLDVSPSTINRDIKDTGATVPNETVAGKDGKKHPAAPARGDHRCRKCRNLWPAPSVKFVKGCPACEAEKKAARSKREPGDERRAAPVARLSGTELCNWKSFKKSFGALLREIDDFGNKHRCKEAAIAKGLRNTLNCFKNDFKRWFTQVTNHQPPKNV